MDEFGVDHCGPLMGPASPPRLYCRDCLALLQPRRINAAARKEESLRPPQPTLPAIRRADFAAPSPLFRPHYSSYSHAALAQTELAPEARVC